MIRNTLLFIGIVALIVVLVAAGPLLVIWSLNTLFPALTIEYTIRTWLSALIVMALLSPTIRVKKS